MTLARGIITEDEMARKALKILRVEKKSVMKKIVSPEIASRLDYVQIKTIDSSHNVDIRKNI